jgi:hypothetical protein
MTIRLIALAALLAGCESYAVRTQAAPRGGTYVLVPANLGGVRGTVGDALAGINRDCNGNYEVVSVENVPIERGHPGADGYYLDAGGEPASGPFRTRIAYDCRTPVNTELNHRLVVIATETSYVQPGAIPAASATDRGCVETYACRPGQVCQARSCN